MVPLLTGRGVDRGTVPLMWLYVTRSTSWFCVCCGLLWLAVLGAHPLALTLEAGPPSLATRLVALAGLPAGWESCRWVFLCQGSVLRGECCRGAGGRAVQGCFVTGSFLHLCLPLVFWLLGVWPTVTTPWPQCPPSQAPVLSGLSRALFQPHHLEIHVGAEVSNLLTHPPGS